MKSAKNCPWSLFERESLPAGGHIAKVSKLGSRLNSEKPKKTPEKSARRRKRATRKPRATANTSEHNTRHTTMHKPTEHNDITKPDEETTTPTLTIDTQRTKNDYSRTYATQLDVIADEMKAMFEEDEQLKKAFMLPDPDNPLSGQDAMLELDHDNKNNTGKQQRRSGIRVWHIEYESIGFDGANAEFLYLKANNLPMYNPPVSDVKMCLIGDIYIQVEIEDTKGNIRLLRRHLLNDKKQEDKEENQEEKEEEKEAKRPRK